MDLTINSDPIQCPRCGSLELDPMTSGANGEWVPGAIFQIKAFRVQHSDGTNWHKCLVCQEAKEPGHWFCHETGKLGA